MSFSPAPTRSLVSPPPALRSSPFPLPHLLNTPLPSTAYDAYIPLVDVTHSRSFVPQQTLTDGTAPANATSSSSLTSAITAKTSSISTPFDPSQLFIDPKDVFPSASVGSSSPAASPLSNPSATDFSLPSPLLQLKSSLASSSFASDELSDYSGYSALHADQSNQTNYRPLIKSVDQEFKSTNNRGSQSLLPFKHPYLAPIEPNESVRSTSPAATANSNSISSPALSYNSGPRSPLIQDSHRASSDSLFRSLFVHSKPASILPAGQLSSSTSLGSNRSDSSTPNTSSRSVTSTPNNGGNERDWTDFSWNNRFQTAIDLWHTCLDDSQRLELLSHLVSLNKDFTFLAKMYAKVIISELILQNSSESDIAKCEKLKSGEFYFKIPPSKTLGGVAGGSKYLVRGILFKLSHDPKISSAIAVKRPNSISQPSNATTPSTTPAIDWMPVDHFLYGGDSPDEELAMKATSHELRAASHYFSLLTMKLSDDDDVIDLDESEAGLKQEKRDGTACAVKSMFNLMGANGVDNSTIIRVPPCCVCDYLGFRLLAMPLLDLRPGVYYGSSDGAKNVKTDEVFYECATPNGAAAALAAGISQEVPAPLRSRDNVEDDLRHRNVFASAMRAAASHLHLAPHLVRGVRLYCAADTEGRYGNDGRPYLLDTARTFPPESSVHCTHLPRVGQAEFYRLFRPEYMKLLKALHFPPLSSDALTLFGQPRALSAQFEQERSLSRAHNEFAVAATKFLVEVRIPQFARQCVSTDETAALRADGSRHENSLKIPVSENIHRAGINMRHIGLVRYWVMKYKADQQQKAKNQKKNNNTPQSQHHLKSSLTGNPGWRAVENTPTGQMSLDSLLLELSPFASEAVLFVEMVARTLKQVLRRWIRLLTKGRHALPKEADYAGAEAEDTAGSDHIGRRRAETGEEEEVSGYEISMTTMQRFVIHFLNLCCGLFLKRDANNAQSSVYSFWALMMKECMRRFGTVGLTAEESASPYAFYTATRPYLSGILLHMLQMSSLALSANAADAFLARKGKSFAFSTADVMPPEVRLKYMPIFSLFAARWMATNVLHQYSALQTLATLKVPEDTERRLSRETYSEPPNATTVDEVDHAANATFDKKDGVRFVIPDKNVDAPKFYGDEEHGDAFEEKVMRGMHFQTGPPPPPESKTDTPVSSFASSDNPLDRPLSFGIAHRRSVNDGSNCPQIFVLHAKTLSTSTPSIRAPHDHFSQVKILSKRAIPSVLVGRISTSQSALRVLALSKFCLTMALQTDPLNIFVQRGLFLCESLVDELEFRDDHVDGRMHTWMDFMCEYYGASQRSLEVMVDYIQKYIPLDGKHLLDEYEKALPLGIRLRTLWAVTSANPSGSPALVAAAKLSPTSAPITSLKGVSQRLSRSFYSNVLMSLRVHLGRLRRRHWHRDRGGFSSQRYFLLFQCTFNRIRSFLPQKDGVQFLSDDDLAVFEEAKEYLSEIVNRRNACRVARLLLCLKSGKAARERALAAFTGVGSGGNSPLIKSTKDGSRSNSPASNHAHGHPTKDYSALYDAEIHSAAEQVIVDRVHDLINGNRICEIYSSEEGGILAADRILESNELFRQHQARKVFDAVGMKHEDPNAYIMNELLLKAAQVSNMDSFADIFAILCEFVDLKQRVELAATLGCRAGFAMKVGIVEMPSLQNLSLMMYCAYEGRTTPIRHLLQYGRELVEDKTEDGFTPLIIAAMRGHEDCVRILIHDGRADVNATDSKGRTALMWASVNGHSRCIHTLVDESLALAKAEEQIALKAAIAKEGQKPVESRAADDDEDEDEDEDDSENDEYLLKQKTHVCNLNARDKDGNTALHLAMDTDNLTSIFALVAHCPPPSAAFAGPTSAKVARKAGVTPIYLDTNATNHLGQTPLTFGVLHKKTDAVIALLQSAPLQNLLHFNAVDHQGFTALHHAVATNQADLVRSLCSVRRLELAQQNNLGQTALMLAVHNAFEPIVTILLNAVRQRLKTMESEETDAAEAEGQPVNSHCVTEIQQNFVNECINTQDMEGNTAILYAIVKQSPTILASLLSAGASLKLPNSRGVSALHLAAKKGDAALMNVLLNYAKDINVDSRDEEGNTAVCLCLDAEVTRMLLKTAKVNPNLANGSGFTSLMKWSWLGDLSLVNELLSEYSANVNAQAFGQKTSLHFAAFRSHLPVARALLRHGAELNAQTVEGLTALMLFVARGDDNQVREFVNEFGDKVDLDKKDAFGFTAQDIACANGFTSVVDTLNELRAKFAKQTQASEAKSSEPLSSSMTSRVPTGLLSRPTFRDWRHAHHLTLKHLPTTDNEPCHCDSCGFKLSASVSFQCAECSFDLCLFCMGLDSAKQQLETALGATESGVVGADSREAQQAQAKSAAIVLAHVTGLSCH